MFKRKHCDICGEKIGMSERKQTGKRLQRMCRKKQAAFG